MIKDPLVINFFWASLVFIGYMPLILLERMRPSARLFSYSWQESYAYKFLMSFAVSVSFFALLSLPLYALQAPATYIVAAYTFMLVLALGVSVYIGIPAFLRANEDFLDTKVKKMSPLFFWASATLLGTILVDVFISYTTRSNVGGDAIYHMSRVINMVHDGFNVNTSFFSNIRDGSYHYNVIYSLYVLGAKFLSLEPMRVWEMSLPFFRLLQWATIYSLASYVWTKWFGEGKRSGIFASLTTVSAIALFSGKLFVATYPNQIVTVWVVLYIINFLSFSQNNRKLALTLWPLSLVITMTHPIYALVMAVVLSYFSVLRLARGLESWARLTKKKLVILISLLLLSAGPLVTYLAPSLASSGQISLGQDKVKSFFSMQYADPSLIIPNSIVGWVALVMSIGTLMYLSVKLWRMKTEWSLMVATTTLPYVILFFPPVFTIVHKVLPVWAIQRFEGSNVLVYISAGIFIYAIIQLFRLKSRTVKVFYWAIGVLLVGLLCSKESYAMFIKYTVPKQATYMQNQEVAQELKGVLYGNKLVIIDEAYGYMVTSMLNIDILSLEQGHFPVGADAANRSACMKSILGKFRAADLKAVGAQFVLVPQPEASSSIYAPVSSISHLELIATNKYYLVYKFKDLDTNSRETPTAACKEYRINESQTD